MPTRLAPEQVIALSNYRQELTTRFQRHCQGDAAILAFRHMVNQLLAAERHIMEDDGYGAATRRNTKILFNTGDMRRSTYHAIMGMTHHSDFNRSWEYIEGLEGRPSEILSALKQFSSAGRHSILEGYHHTSAILSALLGR